MGEKPINRLSAVVFSVLAGSAAFALWWLWSTNRFTFGPAPFWVLLVVLGTAGGGAIGSLRGSIMRPLTIGAIVGVGACAITIVLAAIYVQR